MAWDWVASLSSARQAQAIGSEQETFSVTTQNGRNAPRLCGAVAMQPHAMMVAVLVWDCGQRSPISYDAEVKACRTSDLYGHLRELQISLSSR